jgi:hypothetical protein
MWLDTDKKTTFSEKLLKGVDFFRNKYDVSGNLDCQVKLIPEGFEPMEGINVTISKSILPHHFWIGLSDGDFRKEKEVLEKEDGKD